MADNNGDVGSFLSGFIMGGLVGAAVALVMAPQSGEETRTIIKDRGIELRDRADNEAKRIRESADQAIADMRAQAEELQKRSADLVEETRSKVSAAIEQGLETAKKTRAELTGGKEESEEA